MTEDADIKALVVKHNVELRQSCPGAKNSELLLFYILTGKDDKENIIKDFLATDKFENYVREFEVVYANSCTNSVSVNDPDFINNGWALRLINVPCAWTISKGNSNVLIGVVDTEFETTHDDLRNKIQTITGTSSAGHHHGTSVASIAGAETNNGRGIASVGYNSILALHRVIHTITPTGGATASSSNIFTAIWNLYQMGVPVINVSWSGTGLNSLQSQEITQNGTTLVLAGGNDVTSTDHRTIADVPGIIVVSSINSGNMHVMPGING